ncbi:putative polyketide synthase [Durotheca rogersii]|uniref:putative polyketide synthase n=1 Tax=Durotheca rogersii TaxID=419775 RepID=UPI00221F03D2|nr:putative polyketide synthase [Durotheca rogersii]KAI5865338.1 putative polyketide synthase [Durotheca rogersii]
MSPSQNEPIAVVGSACRFAGDASSPSKLWDVLREPQDHLQEIPDSRFSTRGHYHTDGSYHGHANVKNAYLIDDNLSAFDAEFFGVKPVEAKAMDPQQRLLMEVAYEGLESAGMAMEDLKGSDTGVYVGVMFNDYACMLLRDLQEIPTYYATGTGQSILSNRISYFFDWHGASITIDTACSSSMVAVHMAVQALRSGDSRMALACGSNLILDPMNFIIESKLKMLSPDGRSRMWDQGANGYARGEGVATVVLKTLSAALEDGDHIECIIRDIALNQDGATGGITMPSPTAQAALIRSTYAKAGLDLSKPQDRPQYFEAHGTGTPAGDPTEAEAVYNAFYGSLNGGLELSNGNPLYVGSIKTVLGHTEGTAGVAAILKASLALQHGVVPPNLLFEKLSDRVAPFYKNLEIPTASRAWPAVEGAPRRASVNSFGFGGANAHAILESYDNKAGGKPAGDAVVFSPFVFSALSEAALRGNLSAYAAFLEGGRPDIDARDLAWTLRGRRSTLARRIAFNASSIAELQQQITAKLSQTDGGFGVSALKTRTAPKLLGVFTGQGVQYARMAAELVEKSDFARKIIDDLDSYLGQLPDGPAWSLKTELLAAADASRVHEALLSQPLCTAIQILLVDLLQLTGVQFDAVVGHSSGEIAAAYAAGYLNARDAIYVAYYRGLHVQNSSSPNGKDIKGAMVAVGSSREDMEELCADEVFAGRIAVAASNSPSSITVSGDADAIDELQVILNEEQKFNRRLRVDKAYHSRHMLPCYEPYVASLRSAGVKVQVPHGKTTWFSSVHDRSVDSSMDLAGNYWADNMTRPVLFCEALTTALAAGPYDLALEVGAHPALKGPAAQTIQQVSEKDIPYQGTLERGTSAVSAMSAALGFLWSYLDKSQFRLDRYESALAGERQFTLVKGLPTYSWNHDTKYWHESRSSRKLRLRQRPVHSLLGDESPESAPHHLIWKNLLRVNEMEWLDGHQVQGQVVFPAAGYIASAMEASRFLAENVSKTIRLIELRNFTIHNAVFFDADDSGIEVSIQMAEITEKADRIRAKFTYSAALDTSARDSLTLAASGDVEITLGEASTTLLPVRKAALTHVIDVEPERFYQALADLGYNFSGRFKSLSSLQRKHYRATCVAKMRPLEQGEDAMYIHPAELDSILQSIILAYSYPYDEQLRTLHLPTSISHIRINPALLGTSDRTEAEFLALDSAIAPRKPGQRGITGHVDLYSNKGNNAAIQIQGANFMPLGGSAAEEDRRVFSKIHWVNARPNGLEAGKDIPLTESHVGIVCLLERIATWYLRKFHRETPADHPLRDEFTIKWYLNYARYINDMVESGKHKWAQKEWMNDTLEDILEASKPWMHLPDVEIMHLVGREMPRVLAGETTILEQFRATDILDRYYANGFGLHESGQWVSRTVKQITDRYPHMNILEVGAGTGGATKAIFREIGQSFRSYTYTDISAAFFENAAATFSQHKDRMIFKTFNAENSPEEQGFVEGSYDMVVAFFVIHATSDLERALRHIRRMLKPGGFLVVGEGQEGMNGVASSGFIFGTLPGWWLGTSTGREISPHVSPQEWDALLRRTGFAGVDTHPPDSFEDVLNVFHFAAQAVDEQVEFFREPLVADWRPAPIEKLVIVGGQTDRSSHLVSGLTSILSRGFATNIHSYKTLLDVDYEIVGENSVVVSLIELDHPVFKDIKPDTFEAFKKMFEFGKTLLWVTSGRRDDEPYSNMTVGWGRVAVHEVPELRLQQLDIADPQNTKAETVAKILLQFYASASKKEDLLWTVEPEVVIDAEERELVARLRPVSELNDRYNSARHPIVHQTEIKENTNVTVRIDESDCVIQHQSDYESLVTSNKGELLELRVKHAVFSALKTPLGHKFLVIGEEIGSKKTYLALVSSLASIARVSPKAVVPYELENASGDAVLTAAAAHLISLAAVDALCSGQTLVAHNLPAAIAQAIEAQASTKDVRVVFTPDASDENTPESWIKLPAYLSQPDVSEILLAEPSAFIGLSNAPSDNEATLLSSLPDYCFKLTAKTLYARSGSPNDRSDVAAVKLGELLSRAVAFVKSAGVATPTSDTVGLDALATGTRPSDPLAIIDWQKATSVPVHASRLDSLGQLFRGAEGTYWIVGMSGALGISLCDWMVSAGARNVVLTTRNPKVDPEWIAAHKRKGATIAIVPCDARNEEALKAAHRKIHETLPPIVGVMNGAMVLRDVAIRNMSFGELTDVTGPKVDGSIFVERIFRDIDLDFFVLVSSINCVIGNLGQANYAAANMYMCSLAAQRRKRGLRAATVNAGAIMGAGYMERESRRALDLIVQKLHMMRMSEEDWNQALCEAIDASRLESPYGPEITTGLSDVPFDTTSAPYWFLNPMFSSFIVQQKANAVLKNADKNTKSIQDHLAACQSRNDVHEVVKHAFATQLRNVLQMQTSDDELMASRSSEIGLDSLVSVDIRSWFLKNLQVNIPVLKIMGNDTMANMVQLAVDSIPADLLPLLAGGEDSTSESADATSDDRSVRDMSGITTPMTEIVPTPAGEPAGSDHRKAGEGGILRATNENGRIDWEAEARPPADLDSIAQIRDAPPTFPPNVIVLTGATGLLGHHLVEYLLERTGARKIHCVAIRKLAARLAKGELAQPTNPRVQYHEGDLLQPLLGLEAGAAAEIFAAADLVIHNGADTSHLKYFADLRAANVGSTQTLVRLCLPRRIPVHYVSSAGLAVLYNQASFPEVNVTRAPGASQPAADGTFGYMCSKWTNERLLEQVHARYGLPVCIHRPSTILREGADAEGDRAMLDWVNALLHWSRAIRAAPRIEHNRGALDLVRVSTACESILHHVLDGSERARREVTYVHQVGDIVVPMKDLRQFGEQTGDGRPFEVLPFARWLEKAVAAGLHPAVGALIEMMDSPQAPDYPRLVKAPLAKA